MPSLRGSAFTALVLVAGIACTRHDPAKELSVSGVETYWVVDSPQQGQNFIAPAAESRPPAGDRPAR